ncbi:CLUMA_CG012327, isoform A [Clunio marinus]|uniref:CLUMA_CG012327, isoform A n=1 Tax=Clunio marinus TaxID=568069 RepID=A0A1J1IJ62_9DIPT|nr:CLUMA_CG012327, isoform A [Clunio marinus]
MKALKDIRDSFSCELKQTSCFIALFIAMELCNPLIKLYTLRNAALLSLPLTQCQAKSVVAIRK